MRIVAQAWSCLSAFDHSFLESRNRIKAGLYTRDDLNNSSIGHGNQVQRQNTAKISDEILWRCPLPRDCKLSLWIHIIVWIEVYCQRRLNEDHRVLCRNLSIAKIRASGHTLTALTAMMIPSGMTKRYVTDMRKTWAENRFPLKKVAVMARGVTTPSKWIIMGTSVISRSWCPSAATVWRGQKCDKACNACLFTVQYDFCVDSNKASGT